jgi:holo-[acyl-carrier protein] synthase
MLILRTGIDLLEISRLKRMKPEIRQRFLIRVYTPLELEQAGHSDASLAGRFAAKEAVAKALGCGIGAVSWQDIEVQRGGEGEPRLFLYHSAKIIADGLGLHTWSISISHTGDLAAAFVVAVGETA